MYGAYERLSAMESAHRQPARGAQPGFSRTRRHGRDLMTEAQRREAPPWTQPIVRVHTETGRECLYLGDHAEYVVGMPTPKDAHSSRN
jgi:alpha-ketoglutarate-dependent taurine dioxygenase